MFSIIMNDDGVSICSTVDEHGNAVRRSKQEYPYSYDGFVLWRGGKNEEATTTVYTDRLQSWNPARYEMLETKHFGNASHNWSSRDPVKIEQFLRDWTKDADLRLILMMEYCNRGNGYPCWRFDFATNNTAQKGKDTANAH
jgi:hypothetical protein